MRYGEFCQSLQILTFCPGSHAENRNSEIVCYADAKRLSNKEAVKQCMHTHTHTHTYIYIYIYIQVLKKKSFPRTSVGKKSAFNAGDLGFIPGSGRSPGAENGNPLQYSCLENSMLRGATQASVHGLARVRDDLATKSPQCIK